jgi:hypothetical protein
MPALLMIFLCLISWPVNALDYTAGDATDCAKWLQERSKLQSFIHSGGKEIPTGTYLPEVWLIGFLEGWSWACASRKPITDGIDTQGLLERVDKICKARSGATPLRLVVVDLLEKLSPETGGLCGPD